jgi:hypothetical protein
MVPSVVKFINKASVLGSSPPTIPIGQRDEG